MNIFSSFRKKRLEMAELKRKAALVDDLGEEAIEEARDIAFDKAFSRTKNRKNGDGGKEFPGINKSSQEIKDKLFARVIGDTVLANTVVDKDGKAYRGLTVKKAATMDGIRDMDDDITETGVGVNPEIASPNNPEGIFNLPRISPAPISNDIGRRMNEALNPREYADFESIPEEMMRHFAEFATFIGYPLCQTISCHPTVSNACETPGKDAISPGYEIQFLDSEDIDGDGVADTKEGLYGDLQGLKKVNSVLAKKGAIIALKSAIGQIARPHNDDVEVADIKALMREMMLAVERLAAYEKFSKDEGKDEISTTEYIQQILNAVNNLAKECDASAVENALNVVKYALNSIYDESVGRKIREGIDSERDRNTALNALNRALQSVSDGLSSGIADLGLAVSRLSAYDSYSNRNKELVARLSDALVHFSKEPTNEEKRTNTFNEVVRAVAALDSGEFDFEERDELAFDGVNAPPPIGKNEAADPNDASADNIPDPLLDKNKKNAGSGISVGGDEPSLEEQEKQKKEDEAAQKAREAAIRQKALDQWKKRADDIGINDICRKFARNVRTYGIGIAVPLVEGADYGKPFNLGCVKRGSYHGFVLIEPMWIYPQVDNNDLINPLSKYFFEPEYWYLNSIQQSGLMGVERIHRSWMIVKRHKEVPDMLRPMYYYGGIPLTQEIYEAVYCADKLMNEAPKLAMCKRTTVVKGDPNEFLTNPEGVVDRLRARSMVQDNFGILYVGRNTEVEQLDTTLSEFAELQAKANQRVASIAQMPETKLFKTQLAGMNSAGRYEWDDYAQLLTDIQNNWYTPIINLHYTLDSVSQTGMPIQIKVKWNKIEMQTESELDQVLSGKQNRVHGAIQCGYVSPDEARTIMRSVDPMFSSLPVENPVKEEEQNGGGQGEVNVPDLGELFGGGGEGGGAKEPTSPLEKQKEPKAPKVQEERK